MRKMYLHASSFMGVTEYWPFVVAIQCLNSIPGFISQLEGQMNSINLNLITEAIGLFFEPIAHPDR